MKRALLLLALCMAIVAVNACQPAFPERAATLLQNADTLLVLSLNPARGAIDPKGFHGWPVLGEALIGDADRKLFIEAVITGIVPPGPEVTVCEITPRHGIRASSKMGTVDFVICFECSEVQILYSQGGQEYLVPNSILKAALSRATTKAGIPVLPSALERTR